MKNRQLNVRLEPEVSRALVQATAIDLATIIHQLGGNAPTQHIELFSITPLNIPLG